MFLPRKGLSGSLWFHSRRSGPHAREGCVGPPRTIRGWMRRGPDLQEEDEMARLKALLIALPVAAGVFMTMSAAQADRGGGGHGGGGWHGGGWNGGGWHGGGWHGGGWNGGWHGGYGWRGGYGYYGPGFAFRAFPPPVYYPPPPVYYAPPPVYYAPPPTYYAPPPG